MYITASDVDSKAFLKQRLTSLQRKKMVHMKTPNTYELLFVLSSNNRFIGLKEFVKYSSRARESTRSMQKALELTISIPRRADHLDLLNKLVNYHGDVNRLGTLIRHVIALFEKLCYTSVIV